MRDRMSVSWSYTLHQGPSLAINCSVEGRFEFPILHLGLLMEPRVSAALEESPNRWSE